MNGGATRSVGLLVQIRQMHDAGAGKRGHDLSVANMRSHGSSGDIGFVDVNTWRSKMQNGPGIEITMRGNMLEYQLEVSNRTLRSAAAARTAKRGLVTTLRVSIGSFVTSIGAMLVGRDGESGIGNATLGVNVR